MPDGKLLVSDNGSSYGKVIIFNPDGSEHVSFTTSSKNGAHFTTYSNKTNEIIVTENKGGSSYNMTGMESGGHPTSVAQTE